MYDFLSAAFPWIVIGLGVAIVMTFCDNSDSDQKMESR